MAQRSELRVRLQRRLGLGVVSAVEEARLNEALNSGMARALSDGVPGLATWTLTGGVLGNLALTSATVTKNSAAVTVAGANVQNEQVRPRDILVVKTSAGETFQFLIEDVGGSDSIGLGIQANQSIAGNSESYIIRRSLDLPSTGQVTTVLPVDGSPREGLSREPLHAFREPFKTGTPRFFEQHYSDLRDKSSVSLWPAPTDTTKQWVVVQSQFKSRLTSDSSTLDYPEEVLDAILERARDCYLTWTGAANQNDLSASYRALRDTSDALKNSSNPKQIFYKT